MKSDLSSPEKRDNKIVITGIELQSSVLIYKMVIGGQREEARLKLSSNLLPYAMTDRIDAVVAGLMIFAIKQGYDFESHLPITDELYYNLTRHFICALTETNHLHRPRIIATQIKVCQKTAHIVATGVSCGVDSSYTICSHKTGVPESHKITHLAYFNAGSHADNGEDASALYAARRQHVLNYCAETEREIIEAESNLPDIINKHAHSYTHLEHHTFMMLFCVLSVQRGVSRYYYSSSSTYVHFNCQIAQDSIRPPGDYDLLTLTAHSLSNINFSSAGAEVTRLNKLKLIAENPTESKYLNVCVLTPHNEGRCFKCARTLMEIEAFGLLEKFREAFDIEEYKASRDFYLNYLSNGILQNDSFCLELQPYFEQELAPYLARLNRKPSAFKKLRLRLKSLFGCRKSKRVP